MSRKLDAALAEALGYEVVWSADMPWQVKNKKAYPPTRYSTDGNAMLELDREMRERGFYLDLSCVAKGDGCEWLAMYRKPDPLADDEQWGSSMGQNTSEPEIRALAAYHALTGKEWKAE